MPVSNQVHRSVPANLMYTKYHPIQEELKYALGPITVGWGVINRGRIKEILEYLKIIFYQEKIFPDEETAANDINFIFQEGSRTPA